MAYDFHRLPEHEDQIGVGNDIRGLGQVNSKYKQEQGMRLDQGFGGESHRWGSVSSGYTDQRPKQDSFVSRVGCPCFPFFFFLSRPEASPGARSRAGTAGRGRAPTVWTPMLYSTLHSLDYGLIIIAWEARIRGCDSRFVLVLFSYSNFTGSMN